MLRKFRVRGHLPVLAVKRHEVARTNQIQHQPKLLRAAVAGSSGWEDSNAAVDHVGAAAPR